MAVQLTPNAITTLVNVSDVRTAGQPVVQITEIKVLGNNSQAPGVASDQPTRYRVKISDGTHENTAMLATQMNPMVDNGTLSVGVCVRLVEFLCNPVRQVNVLIILKAEPVSAQIAIIGRPTPVPSTTAAAAPMGHTPALPTVSQQKPTPGGYNVQPQQPITASSGGYQANQITYPIASLTPYRNRWAVKARITFKSDIREYQTKNGPGCVFSCHLLDNEGGEIEATAFRDVARKLHGVLEQGKVYVIAGGSIKMANPRFRKLPNEYSIIFGRETEVTPVPDDRSINRVNYSFVPLRDIQDVEANANIDVLGIVHQVDEPVDLTTKAGRNTTKRNVTLVDSTRTSITFTLWGASAVNFLGEPGNPIALKSARVSDYNGRSLSTGQTTAVELNPSENADACQLAQWYQSGGAADAASFHNLSEGGYAAGGSGSGGKRNEDLKTFAAVQEANIGQTADREYYSIRATVTLFRRKNFSYTACPSAECQKKVRQDETTGMWNCTRCNQNFPECEHRYILSFCAVDHTGGQWVSTFNDQAAALLGVPAKQMVEWEQSNDPQFDQTLDKAVFSTYTFRVSAKTEQYQDQSTVKHSLYSLNPLDYAQGSADLISLIQRYQ